MDFLLQTGVSLVIAVQSLGSWLEVPMRFFSFLGLEDFFFLILPMVYWSVNARAGLQIAFILTLSNNLQEIFKLLFADPRPYWVSAQVKALAVESTFGIPSGHAQNSIGLFGIMAANIRKRWAWLVAGVVVFLIGFSRLYLGVHFVHDVLAGWLIGGILLWAVVSLWDSAVFWLKGRTLGQQMLIVFMISLIFVAAGAWGTTRLQGYSFPEEWTTNALRAGPVPDPVSLEAS